MLFLVVKILKLRNYSSMFDGIVCVSLSNSRSVWNRTSNDNQIWNDCQWILSNRLVSISIENAKNGSFVDASVTEIVYL